jgi:hypothetical protein
MYNNDPKYDKTNALHSHSTEINAYYTFHNSFWTWL